MNDLEYRSQVEYLTNIDIITFVVNLVIVLLCDNKS